MNSKLFLHIFLLGGLLFSTYAKPPVPPNKIPSEPVKDCLTNFETLTHSLPALELPDLFKSEVKESKFCVDPKQYVVTNPKQKELLETYKLLDISGAIDKDGCIVEKAKEGTYREMVAKFIKENIEHMPVKMVVGVDEKTQSVRLNMAVQSEKKFEGA